MLNEGLNIFPIKVYCIMKQLAKDQFEARLAGNDKFSAVGSTEADAKGRLGNLILEFLIGYEQPVVVTVENFSFTLMHVPGGINILENVSGEKTNLDLKPTATARNIREASLMIDSIAAKRLATIPHDGNFLAGNPRLDLLRHDQREKHLEWFCYQCRYNAAMMGSSSKELASNVTSEIPVEVGTRYLGWIQ